MNRVVQRWFRPIFAAVAVPLVTITSSIAVAQTASNVVCTGCVGGTDIAANSVTTAKIANGSVMSADIAANSVTTGKIKDGSVTFNDLSPQVRAFLGGAIANITTFGAYEVGDGVAGAQCPDDRIPISASCACSGEVGDRNFGTLSACFIAGTGAVAACLPDAYLYDPNLAAPLTEVSAVCLGAESADGSSWLPLSNSLAGDSSASRKANELPAAWRSEKRTDYESALVDLQKKYSDYDAAVRRRK